MPILPQRHSLVSQTVAILRQEIARRTWRKWLPGERPLCATFQVSRNTIRSALEELKRTGVIEPRHGKGHQILHVPNVSVRREQITATSLLLPESIEQLRPTQALWIDELRELLIEQGYRLRVFHGHSYFRGNSGRVLGRLVHQNPSLCWILVLSNESVQTWFARKKVPCVVAGSIYNGIDLPSVDLDYRAMARHAVGVMLALGHTRIALLNHKIRRPGDVDSERGFLEGMLKSPHADAEPQVVYHEPTVASLCLAVRRLMERQNRPTALLVSNSNYYLTVSSRLAQLGWRIPHDVSIVSRDEDPFLPFLVPTPARYQINTHYFAKNMMRMILELIEDTTVSRRHIRIVPEFYKGASLGPPPTIEQRHLRS